MKLKDLASYSVHQDTLEVGSTPFLEVGYALSLEWKSNASYNDNKVRKHEDLFLEAYSTFPDYQGKLS